MSRRRYVSPEEDSDRWDGFAFRDGDVVVSARSKHGTTWVQMIVLLLIHQQPELPAPLAYLSPWRLHDLTSSGRPREGHDLTSAAQPSEQRPRTDATAWLARWIERDPEPHEALDSLPGVLWHLTDAWTRRDEPNVVLVHYDDLLADRAGQMRQLAERLAAAVPDVVFDDLVAAASFDAMRGHARRLVPDPVGVLRDPGAFFRSGTSGGASALLDPTQLDRYHERAAALARSDLLDWLHR